MKFIQFIMAITLVACTHPQTASFDKELSEFKYPFPVKTYHFQSQRQELDMRYMDVGTGDKVAVLLHGKNFSGYYWERIINDLVKKNYRVIVPDQIGFGKSSMPEDYNYSFKQLAFNTQNLLKSLNISKYSLVGHSMGGMLAINMSYLDPNSIDKLVLVNPIGLEPYLDYVEYKDPQFFYNNEVNKTVEMFRNYQRKNYYDGQWNDEYEKLLTPFKGQRVGPDWEVIAWNNALTYGPIFNEDVTTLMPKLRVKTYLILGTRDRTGPGRNWMRKDSKRKLGQYQLLGKEVKKLIKGSKLFEIPGLGHMPQFENYDKFGKIFYSIL